MSVLYGLVTFKDALMHNQAFAANGLAVINVH
jgi:hypothetical protein